MRASREHRRTANVLAGLLLGVAIACNPSGEVAPSERPGIDGPAGATPRDVPDAAVSVAATMILGRLTEECRGISPPIQEACPVLVPLVALSEVPSGVRVELDSPDHARSALSQLRCRIALSRLPDTGRLPGCPFAGVGVSVRQGAAPDTIEIVGASPEAIAAVRAAAIAQLVYTRMSNE